MGMIRRSFIRLGCISLVIAGGFLLGSSPAPAQTTKAFVLSALDVDATVEADASMAVKEQITYSYQGGPFTFATRSFQSQWLNQIQDFAVTENGTPLQVSAPGQSSSGLWQWTYPPTIGGSHTFTLTYRVPGAAKVGSDVGELYWQFIGNDHPGVGSMAVHVHFAGEFPVAQPSTQATDTTVVRAWAHGPLNGSVKPASRGVELMVNNVPARTFVEGRIVIPLGSFTAAGSAPRLPTILKEEAGFLAKGSDAKKLGTWLAPVTSLLGGLGFAALWRKHGKEPTKPDYIGDYWREPLTDPPAVVTANMNFGAVDGKAMAATLVDLAQRGYLTIREEHVARLGPDRHFYVFTAATPKPRVGQPLPPSPAAWEMELLSQVFHGQPEVTSEEFEAWAKANQTAAASFWNGWKSSVTSDMKQRGFIETGRAKVWLTAVGIVVGLGGTGIALIKASIDQRGHTTSWWGGLCLITAAGLGLLLPTLRKRTDVGTEHNAQAKSLKKYLEDFSNLKDAPVESLIIWERFLVYGVALGVASHVMNGLSIRMPTMANNPGFAPWWIPIGGRSNMGPSMDSFPTGWGTSASGAMTPQNTSSGSGGGFSGGGGGGGGGGGFGAG